MIFLTSEIIVLLRVYPFSIPLLIYHPKSPRITQLQFLRKSGILLQPIRKNKRCYFLFLELAVIQSGSLLQSIRRNKRCYFLFLELAVVQQVACWLIRCQARVQTPRQTSPTERNINKFFTSPQQIPGKISESKFNFFSQVYKQLYFLHHFSFVC